MVVLVAVLRLECRDPLFSRSKSSRVGFFESLKSRLEAVKSLEKTLSFATRCIGERRLGDSVTMSTVSGTGKGGSTAREGRVGKEVLRLLL